MEIVELSLRSSNQFMNDFNQKTLESDLFFDYDVQSSGVYKSRVADINKRTFQREKLASYLESYNEKFSPNNQRVLKNIDSLRRQDSVVVISGQQAGLLTGPLYTIHKIISVLVLAKEQEEKLGIPVIPIFWIAGEDHDFAEINHVYINKHTIPKKHAIKDTQLKKKSVAQLEIDEHKTVEWMEKVFESYGETQFTNSLLVNLKKSLKKSKTYVEFFENIIMEMFQKEGLVLINSGDPTLRDLEKEYFLQLIDNNEAIHDAVRAQQQRMKDKAYTPIIEMGINSTNIFYQINEERFLLERLDNGNYGVTDLGVNLSKAELIDVLNVHPERFSNNVITRPIMQEWLFPTLAFVAGPGEVTYWAELKQAFSVVGLKMPPVVPRLMMTMLERSVDRNIQETRVTIEEVLEHGVANAMDSFMQSVTPVDMNPLVNDAKKEIDRIHQALIASALQIDKSLEPMLRKNGVFIQENLDFLLKAVEKRQKDQHEVQLSKFRKIELSLLPSLQPQERIWNVFYYLNKYGPNFVNDLLNLSYSFNEKHKIVKL
ncbi:bacillithiol biosynthesis cysteine-adding enzyme BshC [Bacillus weihaiensis]|uniref:Putative cysteine ligase BshC n=1 Tax=Bacillus weihaiensis TaxID=1547283 RepID=A0A1L3MSP0_9BACI|nr:bacillithiol biosynthesis cysteine-adding enzyme BshC [Bacillus weihaiensis]APH05355.1 bacillithiol biosynthesis cysteine-adding enzyme BshC [Bacillus weihaiensis]